MPVTRLALGPLTAGEVAAFLGDALACGPQAAAPLAAVLLRKTGGNPLALRQLLRDLQQRKLLAPEQAAGGPRRWRWDLPAIERLRVSDDLADLMIAAVNRLPDAAQKVLAMAACFGPVAPLPVLAAAADQDQGLALAALAPAIEAGLVVVGGAPGDAAGGNAGNGAAEERVQFVHDWVASAAYQLIPEAERQQNHLHIGRLLLARAQHDPTATIAAAEQMNRARALLRDEGERIQLAQLNLLAGRLARSSLAPERALALLESGLAVLPPGVEAESSSRQGLRFALYRDAVAAASTLGTTEPGARLFAEAMKTARTPLEGAELHELRATACIARLDYPTAQELAVQGLRLLGIELPAPLSPEQLDAELRALEVKLQARGPTELVGMPPATDARAMAASKLYQVLSVSCFVLRPDLFPHVPMALVRLALAHGHFRETPGGYLGYATLVLRRLGDFRRAHAIGRLALELAERRGDPATHVRAVGIFVAALLHWVEPLRNIGPLVQRVVGPGMVSGDYLFAIASLVTGAVSLFHQGAELDRVEDEIRRASAVVGRIVRTEQETLLAYGKVIARLRGLTRDSGCIEAEVDARDPGGKRQLMGACRHEVLRLQASYLLGDHADARALSESAAGKVLSMGRSLQVVEHNFYTSLNLAAEYEAAPRPRRQEMIQAISDNQRQLDTWAQYCPENFLHKRLLVQAELARLQERELEASELYERAIGAAATEGFLHEEALANELAGRFHRGYDRRRFGQLYLRRAVELYRRWGARAKIERLQQEFPDLPPAEGSAGVPGAAGPVDAHGLDVAALLRAGETLSQEVDEDRLLGRLMEVCLVAAGARRGALLLEEHGRLCLRATGSVGQAPSVMRQPAETAGDGPLALVEQVRRTGEVLVRPGVVVLPILRQGGFRAALYLENQLLADGVLARTDPLPAPAVRADRHVTGERPAVPGGPGGHPPARRVPGGGLARAEHAAGVAAADGAGAGGRQPGREQRGAGPPAEADRPSGAAVEPAGRRSAGHGADPVGAAAHAPGDRRSGASGAGDRRALQRAGQPHWHGHPGDRRPRGDRPVGSRPAGTGDRQPAVECPEIRARPARRGQRVVGQDRGHAGGGRSRTGHRSRAAAAHLRPVRARGAHHQPWRAGPGPVHRAGDRRRAGRSDLRRQRAGPGRPLHRRAS